jgi:hypothetical protein
LIVLAFVIPLAIYCLILSFVNRKRHPVAVSGPWDFAGVLFAASGFLLVGGPAILAGFYEQWRFSWLFGSVPALSEVGQSWSFWVGLGGAYFVVVVAGSAWILWRRRNATSIYNVEPAVFVEVLTQLVERLGLEWRLDQPHHFHIRNREPFLEVGPAPRSRARTRDASPAPVAPPAPEDGQGYLQQVAVAAGSPSPLPSSWAELVLEPSPFMRHVMLRWSGPEKRLRAEVEAQLCHELAQVRTRQNSLSSWFLYLSLGLFFSAFMVLLALIALEILRLQR